MRDRDRQSERVRSADFCLQYSIGMNRRARSGPARAVATAALACLAAAAALPPAAGGVTIAQHPLPGSASGAVAIAAAAGGLAITRTEQSTTFLEPVATAPFAAGALQPLGAIALGSGPDGQLWLLALTGNTGAVALEREPAGGALNSASRSRSRSAPASGPSSSRSPPTARCGSRT